MRKDDLNDLAFEIWNKYVAPVKRRTELFIEMKSAKEYSKAYCDQVGELVYKCKYYFKDVLLVLHGVLARIEPDDFDCQLSIYLANLLEEEGEFRVAVQVLRTTLGKVVEQREKLMQVGPDFKENPPTSKFITTDNQKISDMEESILQRFKTWEKLIERRERERKRKNGGGQDLEEDEGDEEAYEFDRLMDTLNERSLIEKLVQRDSWEKEQKEREKCFRAYYDETEMILVDLHIDILLLLYRCEIKLDKEFGIIQGQTTKLLRTQGVVPVNKETKGLSKSMLKKMAMKHTKSIAKARDDFKNLEQTL
jgi:hypothetical protein